MQAAAAWDVLTGRVVICSWFSEVELRACLTRTHVYNVEHCRPAFFLGYHASGSVPTIGVAMPCMCPMDGACVPHGYAVGLVARIRRAYSLVGAHIREFVR